MDDKIYYIVDEFSNCYTLCNLTNFMVGSFSCHDCDDCIDFDNEDRWVKCKMSADAK